MTSLFSISKLQTPAQVPEDHLAKALVSCGPVPKFSETKKKICTSTNQPNWIVAYYPQPFAFQWHCCMTREW